MVTVQVRSCNANGAGAPSVDHGFGSYLDELDGAGDPEDGRGVDARARAEIFARTGIQFMPINTIYQRVAHVRDRLSPRADGLIPNVCHEARREAVVQPRHGIGSGHADRAGRPR